MMKKKRKVNKETKAYKAKELKRLKNQCLKLWSLVVRARAGNKCELCEWEDVEYFVGKALQAHHIESCQMNKALRYDPRNGVSTCPGHHKWYKTALHRSFITKYLYMKHNRLPDLDYLVDNFEKEIEITKEYLEDQITMHKLYLMGCQNWDEKTRRLKNASKCSEDEKNEAGDAASR
jgi:hypothetical protein